MPDPKSELLVCTSLTDAQLDRVRAATPNCIVRDAAALLVKEVPGALRPGQALAPVREPGQTLDALFARAEIMLGARRIPTDLAKRAPLLKWIHMPIAGIDGTGAEALLSQPAAPAASPLKGDAAETKSSVVVTSSVGFNAVPVAEYAITAVLMLLKDARRILRSQEQRSWDRFDLGQLRGKTFAVIGYGTVGREIARRAEPFGVKLLAVKRRVDPADGLPPWVHPAERLDWVLGQSDVVVLSVPATLETKGMIGPYELGLMKPTAILVNAARGDVVQEEALAAALRTGRLAGAALDVFVQEPLPPDSPFWGLPNAIVSGHVAGLFSGFDDAVLDLFIENLARYFSGRPLLNVVTPSGY